MRDFANKVSRNILYDPENVKLRLQFEKDHSVLGRTVTLNDYPLPEMIKKLGTVDPALVEHKVVATVLQGAEYLPIVNNIATVVTMDGVVEEYPVVGYSDFKVPKGTHPTGGAA